MPFEREAKFKVINQGEELSKEVAEKLANNWQRTLAELCNLGIGGHVTKVDNVYYYNVVSNDNIESNKVRSKDSTAIGENFKVYKIHLDYEYGPVGVAVKSKVEEIDPISAGLTPTKINEIVGYVLAGGD